MKECTEEGNYNVKSKAMTGLRLLGLMTTSLVSLAYYIKFPLNVTFKFLA